MANFVTIIRVFFVFIAVYLVYLGSFNAVIGAIILTVIAFAFDGLDGYLARKFNESSKLGSVLDIMSDRIVENVYWILFAVVGALPITFPIIAITRSFIVDSLRSVAMEQGLTAFGEKSMQTDKVGYFICSSKFVRISYAVAKALAFVLLLASFIPKMNCYHSFVIYMVGYFMAVVAIMLCVLRGLPVVFESKKLFKNVSEN